MQKGIKVVAISSGGGHWVQLMRLRPALEGCDVTYVTVNQGYRVDVFGASFRVIPDANRWNKIKIIKTAIAIFLILLRLRPEVVLSTGAAPGYLGVMIGKLLGARTIWLDSVANAEVLSLSGQKAGRLVDLWLTQWPHLARSTGPYYRGSVV